MAAKSTETKVYQVPAQCFIEEVRSTRFSSNLNIQMKSENPTQTGVWFRFHHGITMTSWGEKITITITPLNEGATQVAILSECGMPTQVIDWGKNRSIVCNLFEHLEKYVPERMRATVAPATPQIASGTRFCSMCGKPASPDAAFCGSCGNKL